MNVLDLLGRVAALHLREQLPAEPDGGEGTARYAIDCLAPDQTAAIGRAVLSDPFLAARVEVRLPATFVGDLGLPDEALTTLPATHFRNAACAKSAFLLANVGDDEQQSLQEAARIGAAELLDRPDLWVRIAGEGLGLSDTDARWWEKSLAGLRDLRFASLERVAGYALRTREAVQEDGLPLLFALGAAMPALRLPKDQTFFAGVKEAVRGRASAWKAQFASARLRREGLLAKQTSSQLALGEDELRAAFAKVRDAIPEAHHAAVEAFVAAPAGWNAAAAALAECEWEDVKSLFDGLHAERFNLAQRTLDFYDEGDPGLLSDDDRDYLGLLLSRKTSEAREDDVAFYESRRNEIKDERKLKSAWDRFVFGKPQECTNFLAGLAASLQPLLNRAAAGTGRRLRIRCDRATRREFRDLNADAGLFFALRYAGLRTLLGERVSFDVGQLLDFKTLVAQWQAGKIALNRSMSKAALQLKFHLELETDTLGGGTHTCSTQLVWTYDADAVIGQFASDWERLEQHPLVACRASREQSGPRARALTVDLSDVRTLVPAFDRDRGSLVPIYKRERDIGLAWRANLQRRQKEGKLTEAAAAALEAAFARFEASYARAIRGFRTGGAGALENLEQAQAYSALLDEVVRSAPGDRNREMLLRPLLQVGTAPIEGGGPAAIVAPWHPLRLAASWRKAHLVADLVKRFLGPEELLFGDARLFFKDLRQDLAHPFHPEVVLGWSSDQPVVLAATDLVQDYSLHEHPVATADGAGDTNESPAEGSACVADLVQRYLALHPHEQSNMSVVLFNCDSARLPQAVIDRLGAAHEEADDVRCQILLRHVDAGRLRGLYQALQASSGDGADLYSASEAAQDFMARLRISVIADEAPAPDPRDGRPYDIVFSQDVVSRHARLEWLPVDARPAELRDLLPSRWTRRRPAVDDDLKSAAYLCCPVQPAEGWAFITALGVLAVGEEAVAGERRLMPARQLDFRDERTARIFEETHNLGKWVANYDELLDRRQLLNQRVRIIRFKQSDTQGRNLVVSSSASLALLRSMVASRLRALTLALDDGELAKLADRMIDEANEVSGDIVLRAAKRGRSASELVGVVLSRYLIRKEFADGLVGWHFLDDYAAWLGQREEQLADLLALKPSVLDGVHRLEIVVSEAKYVHADALSKARRDSQKQLRDTMQRMSEALFDEPRRLDRDAWLGRLADLLVDGIRVPASAGLDLAAFARVVREGRCEISLRGYSHVFVPEPSDRADVSAVTEVPGLAGAFQEVYGRSRVRELVASYVLGRDPADVRRAIGAEHLDEPAGRSVELARATLAQEGAAVTEGQAARSSPVPSVPAQPIAPHGVMPAPARPAALGGAGPPVAGDWAGTPIGPLLAHVESEATSAEDEGWLREVGVATRSALQQLKLQAKSLSTTLTPNSALLKFAGTASLTVEQVLKRRSELLTTFGLNVVSVRGEAGAVALAVERPRRRQVDVRSLWRRWTPPAGAWGNQDLLVGVREDDDRLLVLSPGRQHAPHTLIAGSTGSGKSVLMQNLILAIAATNTPEQARIVLIDPKQGVDYFAFENLPHLDGGVIDQQDAASARLQALVVEMNARYARFKAERVPNLAAFNAKASPRERLPALWLIHDEFAEWMLVEDYKREVAATIGRLGVKARAAGIHLIFAAQRPDANVMPMQLRANLGNRLILRVDSEGTSEIALGEKGAERLLGKGHLLARIEGERDLSYAQVPFADETFIDGIVAAARGTRQAAE